MNRFSLQQPTKNNDLLTSFEVPQISQTSSPSASNRFSLKDVPFLGQAIITIPRRVQAYKEGGALGVGKQLAEDFNKKMSSPEGIIEIGTGAGLVSPEAKVGAEIAETALSKLINAIKEAKPIRKELEKLYSEERSRRAGAVAGILEKAEGEVGFRKALGQLKGELVPQKPDFMGLRVGESITLDKNAETFLDRALKNHPEIKKEDIIIFAKKSAKLAGENTVKEQHIAEGLTNYVGGTPKEGEFLKRFEQVSKVKLNESEKLVQSEIDELFKKIQQHPNLDIYEKINTSSGLQKLLTGEIPQPNQLHLLEDTFGGDLIKAVLSKRTLNQKLSDLALDVANIPRSVITSFDMSAPMRQGVIFTVTKPKSAAGAFGEMFKQTFSQKNFDEWLINIKKEPIYKLAKDSQLYLAEPNKIAGGLSAKEERFMTNIAEKIPVLGQVVKASNRAYSSYLNKLRIDVFKNLSNKFIKEGANPKDNPEVFQSLADFINNATGRGDLGKFNRAGPLLNNIFFSPRLIASRANMLNPAWYIKQSPQVRREAVKSFAEFVGIGSTVLALAKAGGADVELDSRSTDFGKIRVGNTRWDIWGGFQQWVRVFSQLASGARKTAKGEVLPLSGKQYPFETRLDVAGRFLRGKLAPIPSLAFELLEGQKTFGEPLTLKGEAIDNAIPLYLQDIKDAIKQIGPEALMTVGIPGFFGVGVQSYLEKQKVPKGNRFNF